MKPNLGRQGFTLVELVVVILLLGIFAAIALPYFGGLPGEARFAKGKAIYGAVRTAASLVYGASSVKGVAGLASGAQIVVEGQSIDVVYGYPAGTANGMGQMLLNSFGSGFSAAYSVPGTVSFTVDGVGVPANCTITYRQSAAVDVAPDISFNGSAEGCS